MFELYRLSISVCAQKIRLSLYEKGLACEERHIDLMRSESCIQPSSSSSDAASYRYAVSNPSVKKKFAPTE